MAKRKWNRILELFRLSSASPIEPAAQSRRSALQSGLWRSPSDKERLPFTGDGGRLSQDEVARLKIADAARHFGVSGVSLKGGGDPSVTLDFDNYVDARRMFEAVLEALDGKA